MEIVLSTVGRQDSEKNCLQKELFCCQSRGISAEQRTIGGAIKNPKENHQGKHSSRIKRHLHSTRAGSFRRSQAGHSTAKASSFESF